MDADVPFVSVVLITYNCAAYLTTAIDSVLSQTWTDLELIVVDDGSTDGTRQLVEAVTDPRVRYIEQPNGGPNAARNRGTLAARGALIAFLDCDDWWTPQKISRQVARARDRPRAGLIYSFATRVNERGVPKERYDTALDGEALDTLLFGNAIAGSASSALVTRAAFEQVGPFDETLRFGEDWEYWIRVAAAFPVACVREFDVFILDRPGSQGKNPQGTRDQSLRFLRIALARYAAGRWWFRRRALARLHYIASYNFNAFRHKWRARAELTRSLLYNPLEPIYYKRMVRLFFPKRPVSKR